MLYSLVNYNLHFSTSKVSQSLTPYTNIFYIKITNAKVMQKVQKRTKQK